MQSSVIADLIGGTWVRRHRSCLGLCTTSATPERFSGPFLLNRWSVGAHDATNTHLQHMDAHQQNEYKRQDHDMETIHLPEVQQVEEGTNANRVDRIFTLGGNPLRTKVRHRQVAGKGGADGCQKENHA